MASVPPQHGVQPPAPPPPEHLSRTPSLPTVVGRAVGDAWRGVQANSIEDSEDGAILMEAECRLLNHVDACAAHLAPDEVRAASPGASLVEPR